MLWAHLVRKVTPPAPCKSSLINGFMYVCVCVFVCVCVCVCVCVYVYVLTLVRNSYDLVNWSSQNRLEKTYSLINYS